MSQEPSVKNVLSLCVDWTNLSTSRFKIDQFVDAVDSGTDSTDERRTSKRKPVLLDVIAVPLDARFKPVGDAFLALTRDISHGGISVLHTEHVSAPYLLVRLATQRYRTLQAVVEVVRARRIDQFTGISGRFVLSRDCTNENAGPSRVEQRFRKELCDASCRSSFRIPLSSNRSKDSGISVPTSR